MVKSFFLESLQKIICFLNVTGLLIIIHVECFNAEMKVRIKLCLLLGRVKCQNQSMCFSINIYCREHLRYRIYPIIVSHSFFKHALSRTPYNNKLKGLLEVEL